MIESTPVLPRIAARNQHGQDVGQVNSSRDAFDSNAFYGGRIVGGPGMFIEFGHCRIISTIFIVFFAIIFYVFFAIITR
jgi:hypothetical protein